MRRHSSLDPLDSIAYFRTFCALVAYNSQFAESKLDRVLRAGFVVLY